jgi:ABC-2 type transport system permease protein
MHRLWLIGLREFKAYVATLSFWVALAIGPVLMLVAAGLLAASQKPVEPLRILVTADDAAVRADAAAALSDAAGAIGRPVIIAPAGQTAVRIASGSGGVAVRFEGQPLPAPARELFKAEFERRLAVRLLSSSGIAGAAESTSVRLDEIQTAAQPLNPEVGARFGLVFMLWLTLTGSLGMLLQAVVRERANRALDSLMAAAQPVEIVFGKLLGVGAVSLLVLGSWLGTAAALGGLVPAGASGAVGGALSAFADPMLMVQAGGIYVLSYVMYGSVTIALGAAAQDSASASNLSRPMFGVLLVAFFAAMACAMGAAKSLSWLIWAPPLTPFMLLLTPSGQMSPAESLMALGITAAGAMAAGWLAANSLTGPRKLRPVLQR